MERLNAIDESFKPNALGSPSIKSISFSLLVSVKKIKSETGTRDFL